MADGGEPSKPQEAVVEALDQIFAPENRHGDAYLRSLFTSKLCVPIRGLCKCERLAALGATSEMVIDAAKTSKICSLDASGTMIRPNDVVERRNTLVLREAAVGTSAAEVAAVFEGATNCPRPRSPPRAESSDSWVVTFDDEDRCLAALEAIRGATCKGAPIRARVRGEDLLRGLPALEEGEGKPGASGGAAPSPEPAPPAEPAGDDASESDAAARKHSRHPSTAESVDSLGPVEQPASPEPDADVDSAASVAGSSKAAAAPSEAPPSKGKEAVDSAPKGQTHTVPSEKPPKKKKKNKGGRNGEQSHADQQQHGGHGGPAYPHWMWQGPQPYFDVHHHPHQGGMHPGPPMSGHMGPPTGPPHMAPGMAPVPPPPALHGAYDAPACAPPPTFYGWIPSYELDDQGVPVMSSGAWYPMHHLAPHQPPPPPPGTTASFMYHGGHPPPGAPPPPGLPMLEPGAYNAPSPSVAPHPPAPPHLPPHHGGPPPPPGPYGFVPGMAPGMQPPPPWVTAGLGQPPRGPSTKSKKKGNNDGNNKQPSKSNGSSLNLGSRQNSANNNNGGGQQGAAAQPPPSDSSSTNPPEKTSSSSASELRTLEELPPDDLAQRDADDGGMEKGRSRVKGALGLPSDRSLPKCVPDPLAPSLPSFPFPASLSPPPSPLLCTLQTYEVPPLLPLTLAGTCGTRV